MIRVENYGSGVRWHCTECDLLLIIPHYTNSNPPKECSRCSEGGCSLPAIVGTIVSAENGPGIEEAVG